MKKDVELIEVIKKNDLERVKLLVSKGADINIKNRYGNTPLNTASGFGYFEIVKYLIEHNAENTDALIMASMNGHEKIVKYLIEQGADVNIQDERGETALMNASQNGHYNIVKCLIDNGAKIDIKDNGYQTALMYAANNGYLEIVKYLIDKGADINEEYGYDKRYTVLSYALEEGNTEIAELLKANGAV